jgi:threonine synthase
MSIYAARRSHLRTLTCTACENVTDADIPQGVCPTCGKVLFATYDLETLRQSMPNPAFEGRPWDLWRYRELLPIRDATHAKSLGEGTTPLLTIGSETRHAAGLNRGELHIKDEGRNPTGSFKARGMAVAVARAAELGIAAVALPSAGNAGAAAAAYAALHGLECHVAMPADAPAVNQAEVVIFGADLITVDGLIDAAGRLIRERASEHG